jgi:hypothetical protein
MIVPPHDFELLSRWYYRVYEKKLFMSILQWHNVHTEFHENPSSTDGYY